MALRPGRPRASALRSDWKLSIDAKIAALVEQELFDPLSGKAKYGARSELVEGWAKEWLAKRGITVEEVPEPSVPRVTDEQLSKLKGV